MDVFLAILAGGLVAILTVTSERLLNNLWPSRTEEHRRTDQRMLEERESRRRYRAELARSAVELLDIAAVQIQKGWAMQMGEAARQARNLSIPREQMTAAIDKVTRQADAQTFLWALERLPAVWRIGDESLQQLLVEVLLRPYVDPSWTGKQESTQKLTEAYRLVEDWVSRGD